MPIETLDHVNVKTSRLKEMIDWYGRVLGLQTGKRPNFSMNGAWLYIGDLPAIHLVEVAREPAAEDPKLEHFALGAKGMKDFLQVLEANAVAYSIDPVPGFPIVQVNLHDPDGNHIHVDFSTDEDETAT